MRRGELPDLNADNPAKGVTMRCWTEYSSVSESWEEYYKMAREVSEPEAAYRRVKVHEG